jgi:nucleoside-diphosphate-sugar epimerase
MKKAVVLGAGGFIGSHMVTRLKEEGYFVRGVDLKYPEFSKSKADEFLIGDLTDLSVCKVVLTIKDGFDEVYQFAADMGGAGYIFTGEHDISIMQNSLRINLNVTDVSVFAGVKKIFYSSSACIYPQHIQERPDNPGLKESDAYPANPDSEYGYEKIFSERLYQAYLRNGLDARIARFHNIFGPEGTWKGGKEKAPAAICRKVAMATDEIEVWGDGEQTRSFLYIDECVEGVRRLMNSDCREIVNIGSDEMVSINRLVQMVAEISDKQHLFVRHIDGPIGVRGRNSNNKFIKEKLGWAPSAPLVEGLKKTYSWVKQQVDDCKHS